MLDINDYRNPHKYKKRQAFAYRFMRFDIANRLASLWYQHLSIAHWSTQLIN